MVKSSPHSTQIGHIKSVDHHRGTEICNDGKWLKAALESTGEHEVTSDNRESFDGQPWRLGEQLRVHVSDEISGAEACT